MQLSFSEEPEPSLSVIRVLGRDGTAFELGPPLAVPGDPRALSIRVQDLRQGVYAVSWRIVSAIDGHATAGAYAFGVGVHPQGVALAVPSAEEPSSTLEVVARWILLAGLAALLGAAAAAVGRFGGQAGDDRLAAAGWLLSVVGLGLLAEAQRRYAAASIADLLDTSVGRALAWRALAVGAAGAALLLVRRAPPRIRGSGMAAAGLAALAAIGVHVAIRAIAAARSARLRGCCRMPDTVMSSSFPGVGGRPKAPRRIAQWLRLGQPFIPPCGKNSKVARSGPGSATASRRSPPRNAIPVAAGLRAARLPQNHRVRHAIPVAV